MTKRYNKMDTTLILNAIQDQGQSTAREIANRIDRSYQTVLKYLGILHAEGTIEREEHGAIFLWKIKEVVE